MVTSQKVTSQKANQRVTRSQMPAITCSARLARRTATGLGSIVRALCGVAAGWQRPQPAVAVARAGGAGRAGGARRRGSTIVLVVSSLALFALITVAYVGLGIGDRRTGAVTVAADQVDDVAGKVRDYLVDVIGRDAVAVFVEDGPRSTPVITREAWDYPWTDPNRVSRRGASPPGGGTGIRFDPAGTMPQEMVDSARRGAPQWNRRFAGSDPWLASTEPCWLPDVTGGTAPAQSTPYYLDLTSWWQISNFAPDGRFVNLLALRGQRGSGGVWSGNFDAEPGIGNDSDGNPRMSEHLILLDDQGRSTSTTLHGENADKNIPAHWTMFQQGAARPVGPGRDGGGLARPDSPTYASYSWADADGDGIYDSRWFELVDAYNDGQPEGIVSLLPRDGRYRWFVAARAIDLSSLVNINTALDVSDHDSAPTAARPIGITPSDVDGLRIFTLEDVFAQHTASLGFGDIHQPTGGTDPAADYSEYSTTFAEADEIGQQAYQAAIDAAERGIVPPPDEIYEYPIPVPEQVTARERQEHYVQVGASAAGGARWQPGAGTGTLRSGAQFGIQDLVELLTYHGLNDDVTLSRLEQIVGGRDTQGRYSPLRDNRPTDLERLADVGPNPASPTADGQLDEQRLALMAMDPRRRLTTLSGATQRRSSIVWPNPQEQLTQPQDVPEAIGQVHTDAAPARLSAQSLLRSADGQNDPSLLFETYASALLPLAELEQLAAGGGADPWVDPEYRTLFYGYDPLFALRAAAHLAANRLDSWDSGVEGSPETPTAITLVMNGASPPAEGDPEFPWKQMDLNADGAELLPTAADVPTAVNIYGIEAQPFLVQASTFIMYTDTPFGQGSGDQEWDEDPITTPGGLSSSIPGPATIDGSVTTTNSDFIFQVLAFQLNNPFDESLDLADYHIEFADRKYDLIDVDENPVVIPPRQSVVVYILSQSKRDIVTRLTTAAFEPSFTFEERHIDEWIEYQFRGDAAGEGRMTIVELPREDEPGMGSMGQIDMLQPGHGAPNPDHRSVLLWRELNVAGGQHEMLVDRLRDPALPDGRPTLDRRLPSGQNAISGTSVGPPPSQDDEGFSLTLWGSIRRPEDPRASEGALQDMTPRGGLPAWCIESRFGSAPGGELNIEETDDVNPRSLSKSDFDPATSENGEQRLDSLMQRQTNEPGVGGAGQSGQLLINTLRLEPWAKSTGQALEISDQEAQMPYWSVSATAGLDPELHLGPQRTEPLRIADMLMAMAVGPVEDPFDPDYISSGAAADKWTTLSESLALALGYDEIPGAGAPAMGGAIQPGGPTPGLWFKTDRGFLRLDDFTPFYDGNTDGAYDPASGSDVLRGDGIPMALSLLDAFRPSFGAGDSEQLGSLTNVTPGVININTAPPSVLRTLGILSPTASEDPALGGQIGRNWLGSAPHGPESDVASTAAAYRDKAVLYPRDLTGTGTNPVSFVRLTSPRGVGDTDDGIVGGRSEHTGIEAVREQPGFRTLGEVMLARDLEFTGGTGDAPHDIDRFALTEAMSAEGVESFTYRDMAGENRPDALDRDYDEKLAIFNSIAGKISVRSDLYAVWFVLHGYQREDVEGLTDDDPLLPSVAKRFLIIVDRSNVTSEGERPRILHFQELPL